MNGNSPVYLLYVMAVLFAAGNAFMPGLAQAIALRSVESSETSMVSGTITMINQAGGSILAFLVSGAVFQRDLPARPRLFLRPAYLAKHKNFVKLCDGQWA